VVVNKKFWASLTPEQQKIFRDAAEVQIKVNREGNAKNRVDAMEKAKALNVDVYTLTAADREAFKKAVKPVLDKYKGVYGAEWFDFFMKKIDFYSKKK
jgi:TRAP-type C4-dicarboxylate transport system substrate-binding protein